MRVRKGLRKGNLIEVLKCRGVGQIFLRGQDSGSGDEGVRKDQAARAAAEAEAVPAARDTKWK
jgi:hypothetical protein